MDFIKQEEHDLKNIFLRFKNRDFSGDTGQAIKNSSYQFSTSLVAKIGSLIFTAIIARILLPDLFGLYSLALSTILFFYAFSDLGVSKALIKFISKPLLQNKKTKVSEYFYYLFRIKVFLTTGIVFLLLASSYFVSYFYYHKPIFLALVAGAIYLFFLSLMSLFDSLFQASNNFKILFKKEILFQTLRLVVLPGGILFFLANFSESSLIFSIIFLLSLINALCFLYLFFFSKRHFHFIKFSQAGKEDKKKINYFVKGASFSILSVVFLGYIDIIMLGRFVGQGTLGLYQSALSIVGSLIALFPFAVAFFPLFAKMKSLSLEKFLKKSLLTTFLFSLFVFIFVEVCAPFFLVLIYGSEYQSASSILRILGFLIFFAPISNIYINFFYAKEKTKLVANVLALTAGINIVLNYFFITFFITFSELFAAFGAGLATTISRGVLVLILFFISRSEKRK